MCECTREDDPHQVYAHHTHTDRTSALKTTELHSSLQSTLSWHQSSRAWRCCGLSYRPAIRTRDLRPAASRRITRVLCDIAGATCVRISSQDAATAARTKRLSSRASVQRGRPEPSLRVWWCFTDHCWKQRHTTIHFAQHVQQTVDISIQLPAGLQCDLVQMAELRQQVQAAWESLSKVDIRHHHNRLRVRIYAYVAARRG